MEKLTEERDQRAAAENREKEQNKRLQRQLRDTKEEMGELARKEAEASRKKHELVMSCSSWVPSWRPLPQVLLSTCPPHPGLWGAFQFPSSLRCPLTSPCPEDRQESQGGLRSLHQVKPTTQPA